MQQTASKIQKFDWGVTVTDDGDVTELTFLDYSKQTDMIAWVSDMLGISVGAPLVEKVDNYLWEQVRCPVDTLFDGELEKLINPKNKEAISALLKKAFANAASKQVAASSKILEDVHNENELTDSEVVWIELDNAKDAVLNSAIEFKE